MINDTNLSSMAVLYPSQSIKLLCTKFDGVKTQNSVWINRVILLATQDLDRYTGKRLISIKGSNMYLMGLTDTLIKVKMASKLAFSKLTDEMSLPPLTTLQLSIYTPQVEKSNNINVRLNIWHSKIGRQPDFIETASQTKNLIVNNIYCLSHRELWEQDKDWQDFAYYYYSPGRINDKLIPLYKSRNYDSLFSMDYTLANTPQTAIYSLGMNINTAFSGAGLIQKLLNDFNFTELKKMDKQNRILLFQYNKHVQKLKKVMGTSSKGINTGNRKSRYQYYKACHIRDVLIRRTKLTRKIFNKLIPNDNFKTVDGQLTLKLVSSKGTSSAAETTKNVSVVTKIFNVSKLQALQNTTETNGLNMILTLLPVLPPVLRPVLKMSGQFTISDLNRLYQRIIYRNERLKKFLKDPALSSSFEMKYAQRLLQEAVDNLIQNGKSGVVPEKDARGRLLKSLSDILKGKQGRFRQYLLGKRVDYSGRSVIVVGPRLRLHECGIPKEMALVLYSPFLIKRILNEKLADTYLSAKKLIRTNPLLVSQLLREIMKSCPVLLNRAPTLHRLGFQAFQPKLVDGKAILLHPLVCPAFNADFDGDQMAVHVPITFEARAEAWKLMLARNNLLSPATGEPLILPSQDMVLGCYYLTTNCAEKWSKLKKGSGMYFHNIHEVLKAYNQHLIHLHAVIWVNIQGHLETANNIEQPLEIRIPLNQKYFYSQKGSYTALAGRPWQLLLREDAYSSNGLIAEANAGNLPQINVAEGEVNKNILDLRYLNLNYMEIYSKTHNLLNVNHSTLVAQRGQIKDNIHLPQLTTQIIRTTPGKILFNIIVKNAIEKRPKLLSKSNFKGGFIKNKLVNAIDQEIDNYFIRKNTALS
jgi:DNA-directed RNA polymerase subunit beta'